MIRRSIVNVTVLLFFTVTALANPLVLGTVMGDCNDIKVIRKNGGIDVCQQYTMLYEGDKLQGSHIDSVDVKYLLDSEVKWLPNNEMLVLGAGKMSLESLLPKVDDFLETVALEHNLSGRNNIRTDFTKKKYPLPGFRASLLPGEPVSFSWSRLTGKKIIFKITNGPEVFRRNVVDTASVDIRPEELNIMPSQDLAWYVYGVHGSFTVSLIDLASSSRIFQDIHQIDEEKKNENYKKIKKAAYFQLISDVFPGNIDLYWQSHNMLQSITDGIDRQLDQLVLRLDRRIEKQFDNQFGQACGSCHRSIP